VNAAGAGVCIEPENEWELVDVLTQLADDSSLCERLGRSGHQYVLKHFDRDELSARYLEILKQTVRSRIALREKRWR